jgi:hypothetical protein
MIVDAWHNLASVAELKKAIDQVTNWAELGGVDPDTIYLHGPVSLRLVESALTDGSKVYDLKL